VDEHPARLRRRAPLTTVWENTGETLACPRTGARA
jgi:hypothetical protein